MLRVARKAPIDYSLCNQQVTIYHQMGAGEHFSCSHIVFNGAFLDWRKNQSINKTGSRETNTCLLVLPSRWEGRPAWCEPDQYDNLDPGFRADFFTVAPGDKVLLGSGPEILTREAWAAQVPAKTFGLVVIRDVDPKYFNGLVAHVEAGG